MKKIISALLLGLSMQFGASALNVMSFNIRNGESKDGTNSWQYRCPASVMMIDDTKPDVLGLQEALLYQVTLLKEYCENYAYVGRGSDDGKKEGEYLSIFYNKKTEALLRWGSFWLSETPDKPSAGWGATENKIAVWAIMKDKESGKKFLFINTRLDSDSSEARKNSIILIMERIKEINTEGLPVILAGDFNMASEDQAMSPVKSAMMNTRDVAAKSDDHFTFNGWGKRKATIDHIWYSGFDSCTQYETVTKRYLDRAFISDHFPVRAIFNL